MPLPADVLRSRIKNEVESCHRDSNHYMELSDPSINGFPVTLRLSLLKTPGPEWRDGRVATRQIHRLEIIITEDYPYEKPIVKWKTPIFHPNIMSPEDGGYVCTKLLERWDFKSCIAAFVKGLEILLANPNPESPFGSDSCTRAAEHFRRHPYHPPVIAEGRPLPKIVRGA